MDTDKHSGFHIMFCDVYMVGRTRLHWTHVLTHAILQQTRPDMLHNPNFSYFGDLLNREDLFIAYCMNSQLSE